MKEVATDAARLLGVALVLLLSPILILAGFLLHARYRLKLRRLVRNTACESCGKTLGLEALRLADGEWSSYVKELQKLHPGMRLRLERTVHAICPYCGTRYRHLEKENELRVRGLAVDHDQDVADAKPERGRQEAQERR